MARPNRSGIIDTALLKHVSEHSTDLIPYVAGDLGISRQAVAARARALISTGYLSKTGTTRPTYSPGPFHRAIFHYALGGLAEDRVWTVDAAPLLRGLTRNVIDICHHGLTEMVNNAVDHSEGAHLQVIVERNDRQVMMAVIDDGIGIFRKITEALYLPDPRLALLELSKGKLTTDPRRHSGEGVFFTSRMFDRFQIASGELTFDHHHDDDDDLLFDIDRHLAQKGTTVLMEIDINTSRTVKQIFDQYSSGPDNYTFAKTVVPVRLAKVGDENLISRSQAKRLLQRVDRFHTVVLDFDGVTSIGQAFADEVFRVFALDHPNITLVAVHAVPDVQQMIRRAEVARDSEPRGS